MERLWEQRVLGWLLRCSLLLEFARMEEVFNTTPPPVKTNFSCHGRAMGFYADVEANCRVYHTCDDHANKFSYRCPEETAFRQDALICDHAHLVDCQATVRESRKFAGKIEAEQEKADTRAAFFNVPASSSTSLHNRRSFSRSFQVIQRPDKYTSNKYSQPGFIFSASVFLRDRDTPPPGSDPTGTTKKIVNDRRVCDVNRERSDATNTVTPFSTGRSPSRSSSFLLDKDRFAMIQSAHSRESTEASRSTASNVFFRNRPFEQGRTSQKTLSTPASSNSQARKSVSSGLPGFGSTYNRDYPYLETLRSIQANSRTSEFSPITEPPAATSELPVHALTASLKPLVPNELEYDPYYPRTPTATSTEAYYTPNHRGVAHRFPAYSTPASWSPNQFQLPAVLPDLNTLDDLVDRRRLFYIPRLRAP